MLLAGLALQAAAGFAASDAGRSRSPLIVLLPPIAFVVQEFAERIVHTGHVPWTVVVQPAFLLGLAFQLPFALAALLIAWALDSAARAVGRARQPTPPRFPDLRSRARSRRRRSAHDRRPCARATGSAHRPSLAQAVVLERRSVLKRSLRRDSGRPGRADDARRTAFAHAILQESTPSNNSVVRTSPKTVSLRFNEAVGDGVRLDPRLRLLQAGESIPARSSARARTRSRSRSTGGSPAGTYTVTWRVISADLAPGRRRLRLQRQEGERGSCKQVFGAKTPGHGRRALQVRARHSTSR